MKYNEQKKPTKNSNFSPKTGSVSNNYGLEDKFKKGLACELAMRRDVTAKLIVDLNTSHAAICCIWHKCTSSSRSPTQHWGCEIIPFLSAGYFILPISSARDRGHKGRLESRKWTRDCRLNHWAHDFGFTVDEQEASRIKEPVNKR